MDIFEKIDKKLFWFSTKIVLLSVIVLPGKLNNNHYYSYGYPFKFLTFYNDIETKKFHFMVSSFNYNMVLFCINIIATYSLLKIIKVYLFDS
ncbi:MAG: hypothetical protein RSD22_11355 [Romboutsia sp.]